MASKKYNYYVGVQTPDGLEFITKIDNSNRTCYWDKEQKPLAMPLPRANDIAEGLCMNLHTAVVIKSFFEITEHFVSKEAFHD